MPLPEKLISDEHWRDTVKELIFLRTKRKNYEIWINASFIERAELILEETRNYFEERYKDIQRNSIEGPL